MQKIIKKVFILWIIGIILLAGSIVYADDEEEELQENEIQELLIESNTQPTNEPVIDSRAAVIYDRQTKQVLWGKEQDEQRAMASTTKIMTAIIVLENSNLSDVVTISKKAAGTGGSTLKINTGDKITVQDLLYGLMLRSGNDAAVALAEYVGGDVEGFAKLMNEKAAVLGLQNTHFVTPHGLDQEDHYTTATELAILTDYALENETFAKIVATKSISIHINGVERNIYNTNELLGNLNGVDGVKTGFTGNALRCLVTSTTRDDEQIIVVVLGADTKKQRTKDSIKLIEYAFQNFERINLEEKIQKEFENWKQINQKRIYINKAQTKEIELELEEIEKTYFTIQKGEEDKMQIQINCTYQHEAPIAQGTKIGDIVVTYDEEIIGVIAIRCKENMEKKGIWNYLQEFLMVLP